MNTEVSKLGSSQAWIIWLIGNLIVIFGFNLQTGYAIVNNAMGSDLYLTLAQIALAGSIYTWAFAISQMFSGAILDILGGRRVFPVAVILILIGAFLFSNAQSIGYLYFAQLFLAVGASFGFVGAGFIGGQWFAPSKFGLMFGLVQTVASFGALGGQYIFSTLTEQGYDWRELISGMGYFGIVVLVLVVAFVRDPIRKDINVASGKIDSNFFNDIMQKILEVLKLRDTWLTSLVGAITFGAFLAIAVLWGPKLLMARGFDLPTAGQCTATLFLGLAIGSPICNWLSTHIKNRRHVIFGFIILQIISVMALLYLDNLSIMMAVVSMFFVGFGAAGHMLNFSVGGDLVKPQLIGTISAVINGGMFVIGGFLISLPSRFIPEGANLSYVEFRSGFWIIPALLIIAGILNYVMSETYPSKTKK